MTTTAIPTAPPAPGPSNGQASVPPAVSDIPERPAGLELVGRFEGSGFKEPPYLVRRDDGQVIQLTPLLYLVAEAADGRRDARRDRGTRRRAHRPAGERRQRALPRRAQAAPAGRSDGARRLHAGAGQATAAARAAPSAAAAARARGPDPGPSVRAAVRAAGDRARARRAGRVRRVAVRLPRHRARAAERDVRAHAATRTGGVHRRGHGLPRDRPRRGLPLRRRATGRHRRGPLPGVAGVLLRRHRRVPARPTRAAAHRPRRGLLQRHRRPAGRRRVLRDRPGSAAAPGGRCSTSDRPAADSRCSASTATTCSATSPASRTSSRGSGRSSAAWSRSRGPTRGSASSSPGFARS